MHVLSNELSCFLNLQVFFSICSALSSLGHRKIHLIYDAYKKADEHRIWKQHIKFNIKLFLYNGSLWKKA